MYFTNQPLNSVARRVNENLLPASDGRLSTATKQTDSQSATATAPANADVYSVHSPDRQWLATCDCEGNLKLGRVEHGLPTTVIRQCKGFAFSTDSQSLFLCQPYDALEQLNNDKANNKRQLEEVKESKKKLENKYTSVSFGQPLALMTGGLTAMFIPLVKIPAILFISGAGIWKVFALYKLQESFPQQRRLLGDRGREIETELAGLQAGYYEKIQIRRLSLQSNQFIAEIKIPTEGRLEAIAFSQNAKYFFTLEEGWIREKINKWSTETGELIREISQRELEEELSFLD